MVRPTNFHAVKRNHIETAQALLDGLQDDVDEILLRNRQAIRRTRLVDDVLTPAIERLASIRNHLDLAHTELTQLWHEEQDARLETLRKQEDGKDED